MDQAVQPNLSGIEDTATPMMAQYLAIKAQHADALLLYRMGDFYELFFEDAVIAAAALGIALTKRGKHRGADIAMCGVPVHTLDGYLHKLIRLGHRAAIAEQTEDPAEAKKRGAKSVVARKVVRLVTPGTLTEESLLEHLRSNYLACLSGVAATGELALAYADISTGEVAIMPTDGTRLAADLARISPAELLVNERLLEMPDVSALLNASGVPLTTLATSQFDSDASMRLLKSHYNVQSLEVFGNFRKLDVGCLGALIGYVRITQIGATPHLRGPRLEAPQDGLSIDPATRANLELSRTLAGERRGSLLDCIDRTVTAAGARLLASRVARPLANAQEINARLDCIAYFHGNEALTVDIRMMLRQLPDLERALSRITSQRGGPRDLASIGAAIKATEILLSRLRPKLSLELLPLPLADVLDVLNQAPVELAGRLRCALDQALPLLMRDGGFVAPGYSPELDQQRKLRDETKQVIVALQTQYAEQSGLKSLRIKHNNILGYFIEVSAQQTEALKALDAAGLFLHRQTVATAMRFTTIELSGLEQKIAHAAVRALALELEIFRNLADAVVQHRQILSSIAAALAMLDVSASLGLLAGERDFVRPIIDDSLEFKIMAGRHPVVEQSLKAAGERKFSANHSDLGPGAKRLWLLTGPNMAGKSTYLRQNALIAVMAQMGSFVPAAAAHIGVLDRLFSRVGAADDLARGHSTFMVEMIETAAILNQATNRSLVILDEIGRGTATFDGLSIAWATLEHLHEQNRCRALFATHYHELTALKKSLASLHVATMKVKEWDGDIVFLHEVVPGAAGRSYGIQAAKLAGIPAAVITRAKVVLEQLEQGGAKGAFVPVDLPLFAPQSTPLDPPRRDLVRHKLGETRPDELSPKQALELVYELKHLMQEKP